MFITVGDVVRGPILRTRHLRKGWLSPKWSCVLKRSTNKKWSYRLNTIPWVIYTSEIAWVGKMNRNWRLPESIKVGQFPFIANGRARTYRWNTWFVKVLADENWSCVRYSYRPACFRTYLRSCDGNEILGQQPDIFLTIHASSLSEALHEAALGVDKRALHV